MIELPYEMTYSERIEGPLPATTGSPRGERLCWQVAEATLRGARIHATLAMPGVDWIRVGTDGVRRQDLRAQLLTDDGHTVLLRYEGLIRATPGFTDALANGRATDFARQYMYMVPWFEVGGDEYRWLTDHLFIGRGRLAGPGRIEYEIARVAHDLSNAEALPPAGRHAQQRTGAAT